MLGSVKHDRRKVQARRVGPGKHPPKMLTVVVRVERRPRYSGQSAGFEATACPKSAAGAGPIPRGEKDSRQDAALSRRYRAGLKYRCGLGIAPSPTLAVKKALRNLAKTL